ncbi:MAG TPA: family 16 glycosylhydrolase, partial [Chitinispirillaceae bacterium]|nr:family 16 glycosylhydrolase [Chitinispirillaceae bacterium]
MKSMLFSFLFFITVSSYFFSVNGNSLASAELYSKDSVCYGRFEIRMRMVSADGVITSFFLWKDKSEDPAVFWHEIDIEVLGNNPSGFQSAIHTGKGGWSEMKHT